MVNGRHSPPLAFRSAVRYNVNKHSMGFSMRLTRPLLSFGLAMALLAGTVHADPRGGTSYSGSRSTSGGFRTPSYTTPSYRSPPAQTYRAPDTSGGFRTPYKPPDTGSGGLRRHPPPLSSHHRTLVLGDLRRRHLLARRRSGRRLIGSRPRVASSLRQSHRKISNARAASPHQDRRQVIHRRRRHQSIARRRIRPFPVANQRQR